MHTASGDSTYSTCEVERGQQIISENYAVFCFSGRLSCNGFDRIKYVLCDVVTEINEKWQLVNF